MKVMKKIISGLMVSSMMLTTISPIYAADLSTLKIDNSIALETSMDEQKVGEQQGNILTYEEALEKALDQNNDYRKLETTIDQTTEIEKNLADLHRFTPIANDQNADASAINLLMNRKQTEIKKKMAEKQKEVIQDMISYKVRTEYDNIVKKLKEIEVQKKMVEHGEKELMMLSTKEMVGSSSNYDYQVQRDKVLEEKQKIETLEKELDEAYSKLNATIGANNDERYSVNLEVELQPMEEMDVEKYSKTIIGRHPAIWNQEQQIKINELAVSLYVFYNPGDPLYNPADPYEVRDMEVKKSEIELRDLKENIQESIFEMHHKMKQLESQYKMLETMREKSVKDANMARLMYDAGMGIELDAQKAELALITLDNKMDEIAIGYEQLKLLFEKPWIMGQ